MRAHYATRNPFITLEVATQGIGLEILAEVYVEYNEKHLALEDDQYPEYRHSMARLVSQRLICLRLILTVHYSFTMRTAIFAVS